jgi:predicted ATPase
MIINSLRFYGAAPNIKWPFYLPTVRSLVEDGLQFTKPITFIVGENGSGKSTIVEAIAESYGLDVRGGHGGRKYGLATSSKSPLGELLKLDLTSIGQKTKSKQAQGFFLRSETAKGVFEYMSDYGVPGYGDKHIAEVSHGEGYYQVLLGRFKDQGLYLLDEPEAALSFHSSLVLMKQLKQVVENGSQVICATHSPIITAMPDADIIEVGEHGIRRKKWSNLELIQHWQRYMSNPTTYIEDLKS